MLFQGEFIFDGTTDELDASEDPRVRQFIEGRADEELLRSLRLKGKP